MRKFWFLFCFLSACAHQPTDHLSLNPTSEPTQPQSALPQNTARSIFYQTNDVAVPLSSLAFLQEEGARLKQNPKEALKIVGYTDDEGSSAYNLAIAQRRIDEVVQVLKKAGARAQQLQTYAVGKEKSFCLNDLNCKRQMRRVDVEILKY